MSIEVVPEAAAEEAWKRWPGDPIPDRDNLDNQWIDPDPWGYEETRRDGFVAGAEWAAAKVAAERDAALAVIEQARRWERWEYWGPFPRLAQILNQSTTSALAKVKADAIREAAKHLDEMDADSTHVRTLLAEADRIEKGGGL